jgi:DNA-binding transcriptional MerR regulator/methylmalonyl-CoA mutase cobalamin-binding subunit
MEQGSLRIGELSRRTGVSPELLRAWERRYGLLNPTRSTGGLRLYGPEDLERVLRMQQNLAEGLAAAEAAVLASETGGEPSGVVFDPLSARSDLGAALEAFDEPYAQAILDSLLSSTSLDSLLGEVVIPYLHELGDRWERGEVSIAQEHFASAVLRGRLLGLARGWGRGFGPRALLACLPGEQHDLGLIAFGLALRARGWRITYLGGDMPIESIVSAARAVDPAFVVLSAVDSERVRRSTAELKKLGRAHSICLGGAGFGEAEAKALGATLLEGGPVEEAQRLTELAT